MGLDGPCPSSRGSPQRSAVRRGVLPRSTVPSAPYFNTGGVVGWTGKGWGGPLNRVLADLGYRGSCRRIVARHQARPVCDAAASFPGKGTRTCAQVRALGQQRPLSNPALCMIPRSGWALDRGQGAHRPPQSGEVAPRPPKTALSSPPRPDTHFHTLSSSPTHHRLTAAGLPTLPPAKRAQETRPGEPPVRRRSMLIGAPPGQRRPGIQACRELPPWDTLQTIRSVWRPCGAPYRPCTPAPHHPPPTYVPTSVPLIRGRRLCRAGGETGKR